MNITALDFVVVNTTTGNALAAFLLPRDALRYIQWRAVSEGPNGTPYGIRNADGSAVSPQMSAQAEALVADGRREHTRLNPTWK